MLYKELCNHNITIGTLVYILNNTKYSSGFFGGWCAPKLKNYQWARDVFFSHVL